MSRRDEQSDIYRRPRRDRNYDDELEVDITRQRYPERRAETAVKERERESTVSRGPRQPDFLREDYGKTTAGQLVVREEPREEEVYRRSPAQRSRAPPERVEKIVFEERERDRGPPYPRSSRSDAGDREEVVYRERTRSRPPPREPPHEREEIDITIREREREKSRPPPPRSEAPVEEIRFRRGGGPPRPVERTDVEIRESHSPAPRPPPPRSTIDREEIDIREVRRSPPSRGRDSFKEEIRIRESSAPAPRPRSPSQGALVARKDEEWVVRRPRRTPPPRDYEKEEIIIRRREKTPEPEPESSSSSESEPEPEPEPEPAPPPPEPKYLPPIIQEIITHHRHIDHPIQRAREEEEERKEEKEEKKEKKKEKPKEKREDHLELEIRRKGTRNGKAYEEDFTFEKDWYEPSEEDDSKSSKRSQSIAPRSVSQAPVRRRYEDEYEDEIAAEADYYNSKIASRAYPGEAYNGATKDWALVDVPPGTERVRMDGVGGGRQEITWQRYNGERRGRFVSGDRAYEAEFGNGYAPSPQPQLPPAPPPPEPPREIKEEIKIIKTRKESQPPPRKRDRMWTEVTKDLVIKEAIDEQGYEYEETDSHFYIIEYLRYVSCPIEMLWRMC